MSLLYCKICKNKKLDLLFEEKILNKYKCKYFKCSKCKFIQTESPYWLKESYSKSINISDTGLLTRNIYLSELTFIIILLISGYKKTKNRSFLDYGGGYGIFVRLMRDYGLDFYWHDKFTPNLFANGFEDPKIYYQSIVAFEVLEHLEDPMQIIKKIFEKTPILIFSTELVPKDSKDLKNWQYFGFSHGQHISFFQLETLRYIANKNKLCLISDKKNIHILSKNKVQTNIIMKAKIIRKLFFLTFIKKLFKSKQLSDYKYLIKKEST